MVADRYGRVVIKKCTVVSHNGLIDTVLVTRMVSLIVSKHGEQCGLEVMVKSMECILGTHVQYGVVMVTILVYIYIVNKCPVWSSYGDKPGVLYCGHMLCVGLWLK